MRFMMEIWNFEVDLTFPSAIDRWFVLNDK